MRSPDREKSVNLILDGYNSKKWVVTGRLAVLYKIGGETRKITINLWSFDKPAKKQKTCSFWQHRRPAYWEILECWHCLTILGVSSLSGTGRGARKITSHKSRPLDIQAEWQSLIGQGQLFAKYGVKCLDTNMCHETKCTSYKFSTLFNIYRQAKIYRELESLAESIRYSLRF